MPLTPPEALAEMHRAGTQNRFIISGHCWDSMETRGAERDDVRHGLTVALSARVQPNGRWRVITQDREGDDLILIVVIEDDVVVVTVF